MASSAQWLTFTKPFCGIAFDALVTPLFDAMLNADRENFKLAAMRDALLPKLMSSEIDVSEVEL